MITYVFTVFLNLNTFTLTAGNRSRRNISNKFVSTLKAPKLNNLQWEPTIFEPGKNVLQNYGNLWVV